MKNICRIIIKTYWQLAHPTFYTFPLEAIQLVPLFKFPFRPNTIFPQFCHLLVHFGMGYIRVMFHNLTLPIDYILIYKHLTHVIPLSLPSSYSTLPPTNQVQHGICSNRQSCPCIVSQSKALSFQTSFANF